MRRSPRATRRGNRRQLACQGGGALLLLARQAPLADRGVGAGGEGVAAVGREGRREDGPGVLVVDVKLLAGLHVPESQRLVVAAGEQALAAGRQRDAADRAGVGG